MTETEPRAPIPSAPKRVDLPATAAWRHQDARIGFEVLFLRHQSDRYHPGGYVAAVEEGEPWGIRYALVLDSSWATRSAHIVGRSSLGGHEVRLENGAGSWRVDGKPMPQLSGCIDVDLEASACTNTLPINRLRLKIGQAAAPPAGYGRAGD